jgi:predicted DCC family thiol-disulfide oxidoreductase YuxK
MATHVVIYDGLCNLCVNFVKSLEQIDRGNLFCYLPMQDSESLSQWHITAADCEMGMILIELQDRGRNRWQGSVAAEQIAKLLPLGNLAVAIYQFFPGLKPLGDRTYISVRDNRFSLFGGRAQIYDSSYPLVCDSNCKQLGGNG